MRRIPVRYLLLVLSILPAGRAVGQNWGNVSGIVTDTTGSALYGVTVVVASTNFGTSTGETGLYSLRLPAGQYILQFSAVGLETERRPVSITREGMARVDVVLRESALQMDLITVEGDRPEVAAGVFLIDPENVQDIPSPLRDPLRALKLMPGVASNNELSNQFSVRGGGYNENLLFLEGFEIFLPFRPRQGEQEGLSLLNADLADRIVFYTGGFPARYGASCLRPWMSRMRSRHVSRCEARLTHRCSTPGSRLARRPLITGSDGRWASARPAHPTSSRHRS